MRPWHSVNARIECLIAWNGSTEAGMGLIAAVRRVRNAHDRGDGCGHLQPGAGAHSHRHRVARAIGGKAPPTRGAAHKQVPLRDPGEFCAFLPLAFFGSPALAELPLARPTLPRNVSVTG